MEYAQVASVLNNRRYFDTAAYDILSDVLETVMENPANQQWLKHAGMKGGSTARVLTKTLYATRKDGIKIELAYFFNDLAQEENTRLQRWMNDFELKLLTDPSFRREIGIKLK
jgi:D-alanyl-D-alanine carboxypeptidase